MGLTKRPTSSAPDIAPRSVQRLRNLRPSLSGSNPTAGGKFYVDRAGQRLELTRILASEANALTVDRAQSRHKIIHSDRRHILK
jgi:hypothetical protein